MGARSLRPRSRLWQHLGRTGWHLAAGSSQQGDVRYAGARVYLGACGPGECAKELGGEGLDGVGIVINGRWIKGQKVQVAVPWGNGRIEEMKEFLLPVGGDVQIEIRGGKGSGPHRVVVDRATRLFFFGPYAVVGVPTPPRTLVMEPGTEWFACGRPAPTTFCSYPTGSGDNFVINGRRGGESRSASFVPAAGGTYTLSWDGGPVDDLYGNVWARLTWAEGTP